LDKHGRLSAKENRVVEDLTFTVRDLGLPVQSLRTSARIHLEVIVPPSSLLGPISLVQTRFGMSAPERNPAGQYTFLGHVSFGVHSYGVSKTFYNAILTPFGVSLVHDNSDRKILGFGFDEDHELFNIFERGEAAHAPGAGTHLAFNAPSRQCVRDFWEAGVSNGGKSNGEPGVRERYGENYYAAFLIDPDGYRLEAVFKGPEDASG
jgi:predicted lactoylglutathione lyase